MHLSTKSCLVIGSLWALFGVLEWEVLCLFDRRLVNWLFRHLYGISKLDQRCDTEGGHPSATPPTQGQPPPLVFPFFRPCVLIKSWQIRGPKNSKAAEESILAIFRERPERGRGVPVATTATTTTHRPLLGGSWKERCDAVPAHTARLVRAKRRKPVFHCTCATSTVPLFHCATPARSSLLVAPLCAALSRSLSLAGVGFWPKASMQHD